MTRKIEIDPVTRLEGHYAVRLEVENGRIAKAYSSGEMFRGFEQILRGRHPMDAQQITQRICGVCPISHGIASLLAQDEAYGIKTVGNGRILRNLILGANYIQSHIVHFYQLSALDFVDITAVLKYTGNDPGLNQVKAWGRGADQKQTGFPRPRRFYRVTRAGTLRMSRLTWARFTITCKLWKCAPWPTAWWPYSGARPPMPPL